MYYFSLNYRKSIGDPWKMDVLCVSGTFEEGIHYILEQGYAKGHGSQLYSWCEAYVKTNKHLEVTKRIKEGPWSDGFQIIVDNVDQYIDFGVVQVVNYSKI